MKTKTAMLGVCLTAALSIASTCGYAESFKVSETVSGGVLNIRTGPGANYALIGAAPAGTEFKWNGKATCMARQDGIRGADWCRVNYNGVVGWVSRAGLMPVPYSAYSEPPRYSTEPVDNSLVCERPDVLIGSDLVSDPNPVIRVEVSYAPDTHNWQVFHYFAKGGAVSRAEQYAIRDLSDSKRTLWTGNYYRNRAKVMFGEVKAGSGEAYYVETIFDDKKLEMQSRAKCHWAADDVPAQPTQPTQPFGLQQQSNAD
jgi:uncharacterized protein YgiM (DUF1202 family)